MPPTRADSGPIPLIDIGALFGADPHSRAATDRAIMAASASSGFMLIHGFPGDVANDPATRSQLLRLFDLPAGEIRPLWRQKFDPAHANVYRGWFPLQRGFPTAKEGIDMGADVAYGPGVVDALMRSIARGLGLPERFFDAAFDRGLSTLRLIRYPVRDDLGAAAAADPQLWVTHTGQRRYLIGKPHVDSGFLTLLAQDGVEGLQARHSSGEWIDVPPQNGTLAVNFGKVLEQWCGGRIRATEHRVIGPGRERRSIPFFHEARADAEIAPLSLTGAAQFKPFLFGDYLWATTTQFVEFQGMTGLRKPMRGP